MKGKHHIIIESARLKYEFDIKRNITIIQGDSATGKSTLIDLISDSGARHRDGNVINIFGYRLPEIVPGAMKSV